MPTVFTHAAVPLALGYCAGKERIPTPLLLAGMVASVLPDLDVMAFYLHVPYGAVLSHRGFTHSISFAAMVGLLGAALLWRRNFFNALIFLFLATVSHPILDSFNTGGLGIAFYWPLSDARYFAPWQIIQVTPLRLSSLLASKGLLVAISELLWVWLPCGVLCAAAWIRRRILTPEILSPSKELSVVSE